MGWTFLNLILIKYIFLYFNNNIFKKTTYLWLIILGNWSFNSIQAYYILENIYQHFQQFHLSFKYSCHQTTPSKHLEKCFLYSNFHQENKYYYIYINSSAQYHIFHHKQGRCINVKCNIWHHQKIKESSMSVFVHLY